MAARRMPGSWSRADVRQLAPMLGVVAVLHVVGFGALMAMAPREYPAGAQVFSIGLGALVAVALACVRLEYRPFIYFQF